MFLLSLPLLFSALSFSLPSNISFDEPVDYFGGNVSEYQCLTEIDVDPSVESDSLIVASVSGTEQSGDTFTTVTYANFINLSYTIDTITTPFLRQFFVFELTSSNPLAVAPTLFFEFDAYSYDSSDEVVNHTNFTTLPFSDADSDGTLRHHGFVLPITDDAERYSLFFKMYLQYSVGYDPVSETAPDYQNGYDAGYTAGQSDGYNQGLYDGLQESNIDSYNRGYQDGKNYGYQLGINTTTYTFRDLFGSIADTPILMLRRLFGFELFGTSLMSVFVSLFTASLVIVIFLKIWKGNISK